MALHGVAARTQVSQEQLPPAHGSPVVVSAQTTGAPPGAAGQHSEVLLQLLPARRQLAQVPTVPLPKHWSPTQQPVSTAEGSQPPPVPLH